MKIFFYFALLLSLNSCKCYNVEEMKPNKFYSNKSSVDAIKYFMAEETQYSLLIFTHKFENEKVIVENDKAIILESKIETKNNGLAYVIKFENTKDLNIKINKKRIKIPSELTKAHKFIYVQKEEFIENNVGNDSIVDGVKVKNKVKIYKVLYGDHIMRFM